MATIRSLLRETFISLKKTGIGCFRPEVPRRKLFQAGHVIPVTPAGPEGTVKI